MAIYAIKDLEKLSGIKAHTIRIWEQRYKLIQPKRTQTNIRYYGDAELKLLLQISLLNKNGIKISKIATLTHQQITEKVASISEANFEYDTQMDAIAISMIEMDEIKFDRIISTYIHQLGFERTMSEVIYPFLERLGVLWLTGSITPVQVNFVSCLIRQKAIVAIDQEPIISDPNAPKFILFLPERETQELSLLFIQFLMRSRGQKVIYIGQHITINDLIDACKIHNPDYLYTIINEPVPQSLQAYINTLAEQFPTTKLLLTGYQVASQHIRLPDNVSILHSLVDTITLLDDLQNNTKINIAS